MIIRTLMESKNQFIVANTTSSSIAEMKKEHIIPVFAKDNEVAIAHYEFVQQTRDAVQMYFDQCVVPEPLVKVSHPIHGRIPEAMNKRPNELLDREKTLYYERMMFLIRVPAVTKVVGGQTLSLVVAGVKAYNWDRLHGKYTPQRFKLAIGFQVHVCSNLCVFTDGDLVDFETNTTDDIYLKAYNMCANFNVEDQVRKLQEWSQISLSEEQFKSFIGRVRCDFFDSERDTSHWLGDQQMAKVVRGYYTDEHFSRDNDGGITLWNLYNLLTEANKSSYVDSFLDRYQGIARILKMTSYD